MTRHVPRAVRPAFSRRSLLGWVGAGASFAALAACGSGEAEAKVYPVRMSEDQWRARLTTAQFNVLRKEATERAYSSPLDREKRVGTYSCAGCGNAVYSSRTKFDSGTGWPSFWAAIRRGAVGTSTDYKLGYPRTEVHCANCGGHLGHVFDDGPPPTGKRHCINGAALVFRAA